MAKLKAALRPKLQKARAPQTAKNGTLSPAERSRIVAKATRMLGGG